MHNTSFTCSHRTTLCNIAAQRTRNGASHSTMHGTGQRTPVQAGGQDLCDMAWQRQDRLIAPSWATNMLVAISIVFCSDKVWLSSLREPGAGGNSWSDQRNQ